MPKERLPKYVSSFISTHGKRVYRYRRNGHSFYFQHPIATPAFMAEYDSFLIRSQNGEPIAAARKTAAGSIDALVELYYGSTDYNRQGAKSTISKRNTVIEAFRLLHGHRMVKDAPYHKLDAYIAQIAVKDETGRGGVFAAETARKQLTRLFEYAVKLGWRNDNPMRFVSFRPKATEGFHSWSESEIEQYRAHWPLGTKQRLAMELMLWTAKRRSDAITIGPQHLSGEYLTGRDKKTGKKWTLKMAPQLRRAIEEMPENQHLCYISSERGRAYSAASFGNMFRQWCNAAGLPHCSAHGLRKAISRRAAELGIGNQGIKSITMHGGDNEVAKYVAAANQKRLGAAAIDNISEWELSIHRQNPTDYTKKNKA